MTKSQLLLALAGSVLMSWGGVSITSRLGLSGLHQADVALFALGVIALAVAPYRSLVGRIRRLEAQLGLAAPPEPRRRADEDS